ncbi:MFS general substrate transporter [Auriculariales sp. MPI-PUGE-AT-0066]|nr:MFS general substrate transporter [Auriculariales sp. MPI-PUGE-AT-0066]
MATHNEGGDVPVLSATNAAAAPIAGVKLAEQPVAPPVDDITKPVANGLQDQTAFLPAKQVVAVYMGLSLALLCSFLDQTIIATALPRIASDLHAGKESSWVATSYLLTSLAFTPIYGRWSDVFGRKNMLIAALSIFWITSLACALARNMLQLIIFRALQGMGGGGLITMVLIIVSDIVSLADRGKYMGITEGVIAIANGCGPLLGGVFSQYTTWRWTFWINLPLCGLAIAVTIWLLPLKGVRGSFREKFFKVDYLGSVLTILFSVLVLLGLNWGGVTYGWSSAPVLVTLILGIAIFAIFMTWEAKGALLPIVPVNIFLYPTVVGVYINTMCSAGTFFGLMFFIPQYLQLVRGNSSVRASALTLPLLVPVAFFVVASGQIVSRTGHYRWLIIFGHACWCIGQGLQSTMDLHTSTGKIVGVLLMSGISAGFTFQTEMIAMQAAVPRHDMAVTTSVRNFVRLLGSALMLAVYTAIVNNSLRSGVQILGLSEETIDTLLDNPTVINQVEFKAMLSTSQRFGILNSYMKGFTTVFYVTVGLQAIATASSVLLIKHHELRRPDDEAMKQQGRDLVRNKQLGQDDEQDLEKGCDLKDSEKAGHDDRKLQGQGMPSLALTSSLPPDLPTGTNTIVSDVSLSPSQDAKSHGR